MSTNITTKEYVDTRVPIVTIFINNISILNTLIELGTTINVMTMETMQKYEYM
jgi:hypothetical protein